jgi:NAD-dependent dihydropyrimidine dehydrogenase PreA subunit
MKPKQQLSDFVSLDALPTPAFDAPDCKHPAGMFRPVVDPRRCEGKAACAAVCPYDVYVVRRFERAELPRLGLLGTLKWWVHGGNQADPVRADQCHGCGLCVTACPENAITLRRAGEAAA